jgi:hypothetical protein
MLFFNYFDLLIVVDKFAEVSIVVVDDFHLISPFVESINVSSKLLFQSFDIC